MIERAGIHILLHLVVPVAVGWIGYRPKWVRATGVLLLGWAIDVDHLLARPVFDPDRCSIGFHPLHTAPAIALYLAFLYPRRTRLLAIGLLIHIVLDQLDCMMM